MKPKAPLTAGRMHDAAFCHYCNVNKIDPNEKYFLPSGIEVCKQCAEKHGSGIARRQAGKSSVKRAKKV